MREKCARGLKVSDRNKEENVKRIVSLSMTFLLLAGSFAFTLDKPAVKSRVKILLWTKEGEADGALQWIRRLAKQYGEINPKALFDVVSKDPEKLLEDFRTASLAGSPPDLLWTVSDHAVPFTAAGIIQPVDKLFDLGVFVASALDAVRLNGKTWGVPIANGSHLMLLYNKDLVEKPPQNTDELISLGQKLSKTGIYALVYNQIEPFWLVPWLGGFKGKVFAADGVTPTLDTPAMAAALKFLADLKLRYKIVPPESDYNGADAIFKEGKAAMIINGDWSLGDYKKIFGTRLGIARMPKVSATGEWPKPYTSGAFFMIPKDLKGDKLAADRLFVDYVTGKPIQVDMVKTLSRLPALKAALDDPVIREDPCLKGSAEQMVVGTPMPTVLEMRRNWDAMKPEMIAVLAGRKSAEDAAAAMQRAAVACVKKSQ
jgi:arabinogalactan oligomer/maltooligosaccharide transport system substrate-binding protein